MQWTQGASGRARSMMNASHIHTAVCKLAMMFHNLKSEGGSANTQLVQAGKTTGMQNLGNMT